MWNLHQESRGKRPLKIWDSIRNVRKGLVVGSFEELLVRGECFFILKTNHAHFYVHCSDLFKISISFFKIHQHNSIQKLIMNVKLISSWNNESYTMIQYYFLFIFQFIYAYVFLLI